MQRFSENLVSMPAKQKFLNSNYLEPDKLFYSMKKLIPLIWILLLTFFYSCTHKEVAVQEIKLDKDSIMNLVELNYYLVTDVRKIIGKDTTDYLTSSPYNDLSKKLFFKFQSGFMVFLDGGEVNTNTYPQALKSYLIHTKIALPANLQYAWDDAEGTLVISSYGESAYLRIEKNQKAYLDKKHIVLYKNLEEAKTAAVKSSIKFLVKTSDSKLGEVDYYFTLKPVWFYDRSNTQNDFYFALF
jgi:hypothetical protein